MTSTPCPTTSTCTVAINAHAHQLRHFASPRQSIKTRETNATETMKHRLSTISTWRVITIRAHAVIATVMSSLMILPGRVLRKSTLE